MTSAFDEAQEANRARFNDTVASYELSLQIIEQYGPQLAGEECATIAHHGETGDMSWLLAWEAPE